VCIAEPAGGVGIFDKLTFTLIGFDADPEAYQLLADMVHDNGGVCVCSLTPVILYTVSQKKQDT